MSNTLHSTENNELLNCYVHYEKKVGIVNSRYILCVCVCACVRACVRTSSCMHACVATGCMCNCI